MMVISGEEEDHSIVIVGGGLCGLATALALHRKGISSLVLERAESLRATGAGISIQANGWRVLDQLKVGMELRKMAVPLTGMDKRGIHDDRTILVSYREEVRCLKRRDIMETLAHNLPAGSIRFGCQVEAISLDPITRFPVVSTSHGTIIRAKVLIGCDGANSVVAKFLGLKAPKFFPMWAARGFTVYPEGHNCANRFLQLNSKGVSFRRIPVDDQVVYFSAVHFHPPKDSHTKTDPKLTQQFTLEAMQEFPADITDLLKRCDLDSLSLTQLCYRAPWHLIFEAFQEGTVTVAGDAMHAMGPFIGQGGSSSIEDAAVLARCIARAIPEGMDNVTDDCGFVKNIRDALRSYVSERRTRILRLSTHSFLAGFLIAASSRLRKLIFTAILVVLFGGNSYKHTDYDCGEL